MTQREESKETTVLSLFVSSDDNQNCTDFTATYKPPIELDDSRQHAVLLVRSSQDHSWTDVSVLQNNSTFAYGDDGGVTWETTVMVDGLDVASLGGAWRAGCLGFQ
eukprot:Rhum_TRINITY_DN14084_c1_g1::Rhum_TRINITY_DN14084_c1_g1_i1::g.68717::m.68717